MPLISIVTPCYNEVDNIETLVSAVRKEMVAFAPTHDYELVVIDNGSADGTADKLRALAAADKRIKVIFNSRNFGHVRSPFHGLRQCRGDAVILMASDLQDPPEMIPRFIEAWEAGAKVVVGRKTSSQESALLFMARTLYYKLVRRLSEVELLDHFTGFGLYDKRVIEELRRIEDPYPYFRGLVCEIGFERVVLEFAQPQRQRGRTKNNIFTLYDMAMLGITNHSRVPLRLATMTGFVFALLSFLVAVGYLVYKLLYWNSFSVGIAPLVIGLFLFSSVQLVFVGMIGEYVGAIYTQVQKRPLVVEKERLNFD